MSPERRRSPRSTPHERRFSLHPLQTFDRERRPGAARRGLGRDHRRDRRGTRGRARARAKLLGLRPFELAESDRTLYHAGAVFASNYLVTLQRRRGAARRARRGARPAHDADDRERLRADRADRARRLGDGRRAPARDPRGAPGARARLRRARRGDGGADEGRPHDRASSRRRRGHRASSRRWARSTPATARCSPPRAARTTRVVMSLFVNPAQFDDPSRPRAYPRDEARDLAIAEEDGVDVVFAPDAGRALPRRLPDLGRAGAARAPRARRGPATSAASRRSA